MDSSSQCHGFNKHKEPGLELPYHWNCIHGHLYPFNDFLLEFDFNAQ